MFRDTKEELRRLEAQLLEEEEEPTEEEDLIEEEIEEEEIEEDTREEEAQKGLSTLATVVFILLCAILLVLGAFLLRAGGYL